MASASDRDRNPAEALDLAEHIDEPFFPLRTRLG
jgi:hypothetical protein